MKTILRKLTGVACAIALLGSTGCNTMKKWSATHAATGVLESQKPGTASGAGAKVTGPTNSATPTTQVAERRVAYYPPAAIAPPAMRGNASAPAVPANDGEVTRAPQPAPEPPPAPAETTAGTPTPAAPAWLYEHVETTIGQHQDAAGILAKAAALAGEWSAVKWWGLICILFGVGGLLWSAGHNEGYPLVCWKIVACGVVLMLVGDNPLWLLILAVPFLFYMAQKFGLLNLPGLQNQLPEWLKNLASATPGTATGGGSPAGPVARPTTAGDQPAKPN